MTLPEILTLAERKYAIKKGDCRLERMRKRERKKLFIERLKKEFSLVITQQKVN